MRQSLMILSSIALVAAACGGRERPADDRIESAMDTTPPPTAARPGAADPASPDVIALGNRIYHGEEAGGICFTCHGQDGTGTITGPNLTDGEWLNADGTFESILAVVRNGVAEPKQYPAPMPPMGGAHLTEPQLRAVAAYVHSLSRGG